MANIEPQYNPFQFGIPVSGQYFVGRWDQVDAMVQDLANPRGHSFALIGGRRFGKSSFLETVQSKLIQQHVNTIVGDQYVFPVLVSLKSLPEHSSDGVFALALRTLYDYFSSRRTRRRLGITLDFAVGQTQLAIFVQSNEQACSQEHFVQILEDLIMRFEDSFEDSPFRIAFLLDETEEILDQDWTKEIFSQLRSIIYASKIRDYIRCVLAGSSRIIEVREKGSPLLNMLDIVYLKTIDDAAIREIVFWAYNVQEDFAQAILQQSGGHPYIAQFLMRYAWNALQNGQTPPIATLVNTFRSQARNNLEQWQTDLGRAGLIAYQILADANTWLTEVQIKKQVQDTKLISEIGTALINLCYHGLVQQRDTWYEYHVAGQLFKDWFNEQIRPTLHAPIAPPTLPSTQSDNLTNDNSDGDPIITIHLPKPDPPNYPTAYYNVVTKIGFPFICCEIDNTHPACTNAKITVEVTIQGFSEKDSDTVTVPSGKSENVFLLPRLNQTRVLSLKTPIHASCYVQVRRIFTHDAPPLFTKTPEILLLAYDTALFATKDTQGKLAQDLADYLAVFVTPYQQEVKDFVGEATSEQPDKAFSGYLDTDNDNEARTALQVQARAFFVALKKRGLRYVFSPNSFGNQPNQMAQHIRLPSEILSRLPGQKGLASCLDSTILFASLLENIGIDPLIILIPGHAFVGWHIFPRSKKPDSKEYDFLETTMIGETTSLPWPTHSNFEQALAEGHNKYRDANHNGYDQHPFLDPKGFLRIIDIAACRNNNINPFI